MRGNRIFRIAKFLTFALIFGALFGLIVMLLWNWLMPVLFGLHVITYWQALGILFLSKILFSGFRGPHRHGHWRYRMMKRWETMTPEEREKFRASMAGRCGFRVPQAPEAKG